MEDIIIILWQREQWRLSVNKLVKKSDKLLSKTWNLKFIKALNMKFS